MDHESWKKCSSCKKPIDFNVTFWTCNVSTCNRKRTALQFCSVGCWDAHLPIVRHRDAWAEEHRSPTREIWRKVLAGELEWPERAKKVEEKEPEAAPKRSGSPTIIRRRPGS